MNKDQLFIFFFFILSIGFSQGPPITVNTPVMLGLEGAGIRTFGKFVSKENVNIYIQPIVIPYNIFPKFQVGTILPFVFKTPNSMETVGGFGDMAIFAKYQLYKKDGKAKTFRILGTVKQTFPTGKISSSPPIGNDLYQTQIGLILGRITSAIGVYGDFGYNITNNDASDNFAYNFSIGIPLLAHQYPQKQINTYLEFNGNYIFDSSIHTLFISPGVQFIPGRRILFETSFQIPVMQQNITFNKTNYMILFGTRFLIF